MGFVARFTSSRAEHVDIIYRNIAHAIFQPCENDQTVLLHFNLKDPILVRGGCEIWRSYGMIR